MGFVSDEMIPTAHALEDETILASGNWGSDGLTYEITDTGILRILGHSSTGSSPTSTYPAKWASYPFHVLDMSGCDINTIQTNVFGNADYFANITEIILPNTLTTLTGNNFIKCKDLKKITGPIELNWTGTASASVTSWRNCKNVEEIHFTKGSTGVSYDYNAVASAGSYQRTPWYFSRANPVIVTFDDDITYLGTNMFRDDNIIYYPPASLESTGANCFLNSNVIQTTGYWGSDGLTYHLSRDGTLKISGTSTTGFTPSILPSEWANLYITRVDMSEAVVATCSFSWDNAFENVTEFVAPETTMATMITFANSADGASLKSIEGPVSSSWVFTNMGDDVVVEDVHLTAGTTSGMSPDYIDPYYQLTPWYNTARFQAVNLTLDEGIVRLGANMFRDGHIATYAPPSTLTTIGDDCFLNCTIDSGPEPPTPEDDKWGNDGLYFEVVDNVLRIYGDNATATPSTSHPRWDSLNFDTIDMSDCTDLETIAFVWSEAITSKVQTWILPNTAETCVPTFPVDNDVLHHLTGPVSMDWSDGAWRKAVDLDSIHFLYGKDGRMLDYSTEWDGLFHGETPWFLNDNDCVITVENGVNYFGNNAFRYTYLMQWYEPDNFTTGVDTYRGATVVEGRISLRLNIADNLADGYNNDLPIYKVTLYGTDGYNYDGSAHDALPWNASRWESVDIVFEGGIKSIGAYTFADCDEKVNIPKVLPNTLTAIRESAFSNAHFASDDLALTLPASLNYIGAYAFEANDLMSVYIENTGAMEIGVGAFQYNNIFRIVVLSELLDIIPDTTYYGSIASNPKCRVIHINDGNYHGYWGANCQFSTSGINDRILTISGELSDKTWGEGIYRIPWDLLAPESIVKLDLSGVTSAIPQYICLDEGEMTNLREIDLGQNVRQFTHFCENAPALTKVAFSGNALMDGAFPGSPALKQFTIYGSPMDLEAPADDLPWVRVSDSEVSIIGAEFIGSYQFREFAGTIALDGDVEYVHPYAFAYAKFTRLDESGFKNIQSHAFDSAELEILHVPEGVLTIGDEAFANCTRLLGIYFDYGCVATVGDRAFADCTGLDSVHFDRCNVSLRSSVFDGCTNLTTIYVGGDVTVQDDTWNGTQIMYLSSTVASICPAPDSSDFGGIFLGDKRAISEYYDRFHPENSHGYLGHSITWQNSLDEQGRLVRTLEGWLDTQNVYYDYTASSYEEQYITLYKVTLNYAFANSWLDGFDMFKVSLPALEEVEFGPSWCGIVRGGFIDTPNLRVITINSAMKFEGTCFGNAENTFETLNIIRGDGTLKATWTTEVPWNKTTNTITVNVAEGVGNFPRGLFQNSQATIEEIYFPESVTLIGYNAFQFASGLKSVVFANPNIVIDRYAFNGCTSLDYLEITEGMSIGFEAFKGAGLKAVVFLGAPASVDATAFADCNVEKILNLTSLEITPASPDYGGVASNPDVEIATGFDSSFMIEEIGDEPPAPPKDDGIMKMLLWIVPILIVLAVVFIVAKRVF